MNSDKGINYFKVVRKKIRWKETRIEKSMQSLLQHPFPESKNRKDFWQNFKSSNFDYIAKKHGGAGIGTTIKRMFGKIK